MVDDITNDSNGEIENHKVMVNVLCNTHKGFNIFHFNARSLNHDKLDYVRHVFVQSRADVICVSETWFSSGLPASLYSLDGYNLFRNDRLDRRGGGVAIYCKTGYDARLVSVSNLLSVEFINIEICARNIKILISCVYNPHKQFSLQPYFSDLENRLIDYDFYVVCGDFNVNLLNSDSASTSLRDLVSSTGLTFVNTVTPTRFASNSTPSLLDLMIVSNPDIVTKFDQISFISDHDLLFCCFDVSVHCSTPIRSFSYRDFNCINYNSMFDELVGVEWRDCWMLASVNDKLNWFMDIVSNIFDKYVPVKTVSVSSYSCPWFSPLILNLIKTKNKCHSRWKKTSTLVNWKSYSRARNVANLAIKQVKKTNFSSKLSSSLSSKQLWSNIRKLNVIKKDTCSCPCHPDDLNKFFLSTVVSDAPCNTKFLSCSVQNEFEFCAVSESDILFHVSKISSNAVGYDGLPIRFIKLILPYILSPLTHIVNHCLTTSTFPDNWKIATITPIAKKVNAKEVNDFRPISILPALSKVCERIMSTQIIDYVTKNQLISPLQSGFRPKHSCATAILKIMEDIRVRLDDNQFTFLCLLDFSKAFDTVDHNIFCSKLSNFFHFSGSAVKLISSYLSHRLQRVKVGNRESSFNIINAGVPQGSTLGPLFFSMFVNDIFSVCHHVHLHAYADDIQLYISSGVSDVVNLASKVNSDLCLIKTWAEDNCLRLNSDKCVVLPISSKTIDLTSLPIISIGSNKLLFVNCHINHVVVKIYNILRILRYSGAFTPIDIKKRLVIQLIIPHISFFTLVFSKLDSLSKQKLIVTFNNATRYVFGLKRFDHISAYDKSILGIGIVDYMKVKNLIFLHGLLHSKTPGYLYSLLRFCQSARSCQLIVPKFKHLLSSRFFFINAIRLWNSLPLNMRNIHSKHAFKIAVHNYLALSV